MKTHTHSSPRRTLTAILMALGLMLNCSGAMDRRRENTDRKPAAANVRN